MKTKELYEALDILSPFDSALEWDNVGLLIGDENSEVKGIYLCLDLSRSAVCKAKENGANLIVTHHPAIFGSIKRVTGDTALGDIILSLAKNEISVISMHTNFDVHIMGKIAAKRAGFSGHGPLEITNFEKNIGIGSIGDVKETTLKALALNIKEAFSLPYVTYYGDEDKAINKVAMVPGSGKSDIGISKKLGADVLITGDISHHEAIDSVAEGLSIIDAGHYGLEHIFVEYMKEYFEKNHNDISVTCETIHFPGRVL